MRLNGTPKRLLALLLVTCSLLSFWACGKTEEDPPAQRKRCIKNVLLKRTAERDFCSPQ